MRIAWIGVDRPHSAAYLTTFGAIPEIEIAAFCDPDGGRREKLPREYPGSAFYTDVEALIAAEKFDAAFVALPNNLAAEAGRRLAAAGKHLFIEKPVAPSVAEAEALFRVVHERGLKFSTGYTWRFDPIARDIQALIAGDALGTIWSLEARMVTSTVKSRDPRHYLFDRSVSGGGILAWLGVHWMDLLRYWMGCEVEAVTALTGNVGGEAIDVEDIAAVSLRFQNGALASLHAGYLLPAGYETFFGIRGSRGWITWDPMTPVLRIHSDAPGIGDAPDRTVTYTKREAKGYGGTAGRSLVLDWLAAIQEDRAPRVGPDEALWALRLVHAAYASAESGRVVRLECT